MTKQTARNILKPWARYLIRNVYDYDDVVEALYALCPRFEYPDWDYRRVGDFIRHFAED